MTLIDADHGPIAWEKSLILIEQSWRQMEGRPKHDQAFLRWENVGGFGKVEEKKHQ